MTANDLIYKSIYIITEYYNNNLQPYFDNISEDVLWIGPAERQEIRGREQVISTFSAEVHGLASQWDRYVQSVFLPSKPHMRLSCNMKSIPIILMEIQIYTIKGFTTPGTKKGYTQKAVLISAGRLLFFTSVTHGHATAETPFIRYTIKV